MEDDVAVRDVLGAMLVEVCFACALYGVTTIQAFLYYRTALQDTRSLKLLVGVVWFLESLHTAFCIFFIYAYTIGHFGDYDFLDRINWGAGTTILISVVISAIVHAFYLEKIWIASNGSKVIMSVLVILAVCSFGCGLGSFAFSLEDRAWTIFRFYLSPFVTMTVGLACAAAVDIMIAIALAYRAWSRTKKGEKLLDNKADTVLAFAVDTNAITAIFSLLCVIFFVAQRHSLVFLGFIEIQTKLYANSLLGSLNARALASDKPTSATQLTSYNRHPPRLQFRSQSRADFTNVTVIQETVITHDDCEYDDSKAVRVLSPVEPSGREDSRKGRKALV